MSKIEVREDKRSIGRASSPDDKFRSISLPTSGLLKHLFKITVFNFRKIPRKVVFPYHETHSSRDPQISTISRK